VTAPYAGFIVNPSGQTATVTVTSANGATPTCYTTAAGTATQTNPATITASTGFFVAADGPYVLSVKVGGAEQYGGTYVLEDSQVVSVAVPANPAIPSNLASAPVSAQDNTTASQAQVVVPWLQLGMANDPAMNFLVEYWGHSGAAHMDVLLGKATPSSNGDAFLIEYAESEKYLIFRPYYSGAFSSQTFVDGTGCWTFGDQPPTSGASLPNVNGTTSGTIHVKCILQSRNNAHSPQAKMYVLYCDAYYNSTATAQTIDLTYAGTYQKYNFFTNAGPFILSSPSGFAPTLSVSDGKTLTLPASMGAAYTGNVLIVGCD